MYSFHDLFHRRNPVCPRFLPPACWYFIYHVEVIFIVMGVTPVGAALNPASRLLRL